MHSQWIAPLNIVSMSWFHLQVSVLASSSWCFVIVTSVGHLASMLLDVMFPKHGGWVKILKDFTFA